jgi:hypothetical protein
VGAAVGSVSSAACQLYGASGREDNSEYWESGTGLSRTVVFVNEPFLVLLFRNFVASKMN